MNYRISRNLEYALMTLSYMSQKKGACISAREISQTFNCPFHPVSKVLQKLVDHKIVVSKQGTQGGYFLNCRLDELSLYQLMSSILPPLEIAACLNGACDLLETCNIKSPIHYLNKKVVNFYRQLNVGDILNCGAKEPLSKSRNKSLFAGHKNNRAEKYKNKLLTVN